MFEDGSCGVSGLEPVKSLHGCGVPDQVLRSLPEKRCQEVHYGTEAPYEASVKVDEAKESLQVTGATLVWSMDMPSGLMM